MKLKRVLRKSSYNDYIAVDIVDEKSKIVETPFYLKANETKEVLYKDVEERRWVKTKIKISNDFKELNCSDNEGLSWNSSFDELLMDGIIQFN